jgi:hypothetical protein
MRRGGGPFRTTGGFGGFAGPLTTRSPTVEDIMEDLEQRELQLAARMPAGSVLAVLYGQHAQIRNLFALVGGSQGQARQASFNQLRQLLALHEAGEEMVLRPVSKKVVGAEIVDARNEEESEAARVLAELEMLDVDGALFAAKLAAFETAVSDHALREESEEFPRLLSEISVEEQRKMGQRLLTVQKAAPTHPHPATAGSTVAQYAIGPFASLLDRARDAFAARQGE